jgi:two-component system, OmpR family, phosphate regulon response regulator PhoB
MGNDDRESVLVIDDEEDLRNLLLYKLGEAGFRAEAAATARAGLAAVASLHPTVLVLDLMLPDLPGTEVCKRLRADAAYRDLGILILSARGEETDRVVGLEIGADDYVVKPFSVREVVARVRALARRVSDRRAAPPPTEERMLRWRELRVDPVAHRAFLAGVELALTPMEFRLLALLLAPPERAFSRDRLLDEVWGITADVTTRTVDTHVKRLREKLGAVGELVETVRGVGYRLRPA